MPQGDGTGPNGQGPRSGRGRGPCQINVSSGQNQSFGQRTFGRLKEKLGQGMKRQESGKGRNRRQRD